VKFQISFTKLPKTAANGRIMNPRKFKYTCTGQNKAVKHTPAYLAYSSQFIFVERIRDKKVFINQGTRDHWRM